MTRSIYILVPTTNDGAAVFPPPAFDEGRLAAELEDYGDWSVSVVTDGPRSIGQADVFLLLSDEPSEWMRALEAPKREPLMRRLILLQCHRPPSMLIDLEDHQVAGGVPAMLFRRWQVREDNGQGLVGLRSVVERLGGQCLSESFTSDRYCAFQNPHASTLTQSLAQYISALMDEYAGALSS